MANTCFISLRVHGPEASLRALDAELAKALDAAAPEDEKWAGCLWLHMGLDGKAAHEGKLHADPARGFDEIAREFERAYPVEIRTYSHRDIGDYAK